MFGLVCVAFASERGHYDAEDFGVSCCSKGVCCFPSFLR